MNVLPVVILWGDLEKLLLKSDDPDFEWRGITNKPNIIRGNRTDEHTTT